MASRTSRWITASSLFISKWTFLPTISSIALEILQGSNYKDILRIIIFISSICQAICPAFHPIILSFVFPSQSSSIQVSTLHSFLSRKHLSFHSIQYLSPSPFNLKIKVNKILYLGITPSSFSVGTFSALMYTHPSEFSINSKSTWKTPTMNQ